MFERGTERDGERKSGAKVCLEGGRRKEGLRGNLPERELRELGRSWFEPLSLSLG